LVAVMLSVRMGIDAFDQCITTVETEPDDARSNMAAYALMIFFSAWLACVTLLSLTE
jgi:hypothetical protein